jgi:hypothetical protein
MTKINTKADNVPDEGKAALSSQPKAEAEVASVDKIRDIIFGTQIKNYDARLLRLEESFAREVSELKDMIRSRLESTESFFKKESDALSTRVKSEREERTSLVSSLDRDLKETQNNLMKRLNEIDAAMNDGDSMLRKELMTESRKLLEEIGRRHDSIRSLLESRMSELRIQKTDRALMSDLFREMASQLNDVEASFSE